MSARVAVIGGGAAGMAAAIALAEGGADVTLFEHNEKLGKKLYITGKGRCNLSNDCEAEDVLANVVHGDKFLRSAIYGFTPKDAMAFFEGLGLKIKVERGGRVFPVSDKSSDVIKALASRIDSLGVDVRLRAQVSDIRREGEEFVVDASIGKEKFDFVVIATGGASYPSTGSTGDGYKFAERFGHAIVRPTPALTALKVKQNVSGLKGLSLKNVRLTAFCGGRELKSDFGEMMFTDCALTGPIALTLSSYVTRERGVTLSLDLKPALDEKTLDNRLLREFDSRKNQDIKNVMRALLPERLNVYALERAGVDASQKVNALQREERARIVATLKDMRFDVTGTAPFTEAVITSGGVALKDVKPDGESKLQAGLYFAGEVLDVDALTGGFNLQIAWATAINAARSILKKMR